MRHALHPCSIGTLQQFEACARENRLRYPHGDYDVQALLRNCNDVGYNKSPLIDAELHEATRVYNNDDGSHRIHLFMPEHMNASACVVHKPGHWVCVKKMPDFTILLCDSLHRDPFLLTPTELSDFLSSILLYQREANEATVGEWSVCMIAAAPLS